MEHLSQPVAFLREAVRILRPGGVADIRVPHAQGWLAHAPGHQTLFSLQWFDCISSGDDMQESAIVEGCTVRVFLRLHHYRIRGKLLSLPVRLLSRAWEGYFNRTHNRQVWWEQLGVLPPSEIHVLITKRERPR
jgi:SAM-dependent methyltransferase